MSVTAPVARIYGFFASRRLVLFSVTLALVLAGGVAFFRLDISEDIRAMLPETPPYVREEFKLLQQAPFSKKVIVTLTRGEEISLEELIRAGDRLSASMGSPFFGRVVSGPPEGAAGKLVLGLFRAFPSLFTEEDREAVAARLTRKAVRGQLEGIRERLRSPGTGLAMKTLMREDPLDLHVLALRKLGVANTIPNVRIQQGRFISADKRSLLIIADSPVELADAAGSQALMDRFRDLVKAAVPAGIRVFLVSGHAYAAANAGTVKADLVRVLGCSSLLITAIFFLFLRSWRAIFVFLLPVSALCLAALGVRLSRGEMSGITLGFGAVLLGITVDYAVHVYFALRNGSQPPGIILEQVGRPVLFSGMTTIAAFATLLLSDLPGQRELALFSIYGIAAAMAFSLVALPHLIPPAPGGLRKRVVMPVALRLGPSLWILLAWSVLMLLGTWQAFHVRMDGNLRSASMVTPEIEAAERATKAAWGQLKGRTIGFVEAGDLEKALAINDSLYARLEGQHIPSITSLAPLLPSLSLQKANRERWKSFWELHGAEALRRLAEEGKALGFSSRAFEPFEEALRRPPAAVFPEDLRESGLGDLLDTLLSGTPQGVRVITLAGGSVDRLVQASGSGPGGLRVRWVSENRFGKAISKALEKDFTQFVIRASAAVLLLLFLLYRRPAKTACTLVPVATGLVVMFGIMGAAGISFNLFNIIAAILVIGLGVDYGIFMVAKMSEGYHHATEQALVVSGLTTLAGLGSLVLARHPALHSIGLTVLLGIGAAIPAALLVIPAAYGAGGKIGRPHLRAGPP